jgi:glycosyltransferase involved in cell wall biosynthesis
VKGKLKMDRAVSFEKGNVVDLKEKLSELISNSSEVESYKSQAQDYICEKYNWDSVVEKTMKVYGK